MESGIFDQLEKLLKQSKNEYQNNDISTAEILAELGAPSASIAILDNGKISSRCYSTTGDDVETLFQACSISKPVFGVAVMKLIEEGRFNLDDKICDLLPEDVSQLLTRDPKTKPLVKSITVAQLMSHTSGLSIGGFPGYPNENHMPTNIYQILEGKTNSVNTEEVKLVSLPGQEFMYSGGGIMVLQSLVENVMKKPLSEIMESYIFKPLEMTRSCYHIKSEEEKNLSKAHFTGYTKCDNKWHFQPEHGAAGLWTTPTDLMKLIRFIQESFNITSSDDDDNQNNKTKILKKETVQKMLTPIKSTMALTWFVENITFSHTGGNLPGWTTFVYGYIDDSSFLPNHSKRNNYEIPNQSGISIMTNSLTGINVYRKLVHAITYLKGWPPFFEDPLKPPSNTTIPLGILLSTSNYKDLKWKNWIGIYSSKTKQDKNEDEEDEMKWEFLSDLNDHPIIKIDDLLPDIILISAATPPKLYINNKKSIDFILDGLEMMVRLGWDDNDDDEKKTIEVWNGKGGSCTVLSKV